MNQVFELKNIVKRFPGIVANDQVNFSATAGEIRALVGENGAGKSTLMNILYGLYQPDEGQIFIKGKPVQLHSPLDAIEAGLGMIHQEFKLFPSFTVYENIIFGSEITKNGFIDNQTSVKKVEELSEMHGLLVDPLARVQELPVGVRQRVEILKMLFRKAEILIMDEPTGVLTPQECDSLFLILRKLASMGKTIIFISHKLEEVFDISDSITVLSKGKVTGTLKTHETDTHEICKLMVGKDISFYIQKPEQKLGGEVLIVENLTIKNSEKRKVVNNITLKIRKGEIVGIAGVAGNGQDELVEAISGNCLGFSGSIKLLGKEINDASIKDRRSIGLAYIPEDRQNVGLALDASVSDNLIMGFQNSQYISKNGWLNERKINSFSNNLIDEYSIKISDSADAAKNLSGGNQQKIVVAREISHNADLLICEQPTRGLDVQSTKFVHEKIVNYRDQGKAILLSSTDLNEIMSLSDRILVMFNGIIMGEFDGDGASEHKIGLCMAGVKLVNDEEI